MREMLVNKISFSTNMKYYIIIIFFYVFKVFDGKFVVKLSLAFSRLEIEFKKCLISSKDSEGDYDSSSCYVYFLNNTYESVIYLFFYN
jgi:hypothetical protein